MTQHVSNFKENAVHTFEKTVEVGKAIGQRIVTLDRSEEVYGTTPESQLKGRDRMITHELARVALGTLLVAFFTYQCIMHPGGMNYFMTGLGGFGTLVALKEAAIQSIARQKEKKKFEIAEETAETSYSFQEWKDEFIQGVTRSFSDMNHSLGQLLSKNKNNDDSGSIESSNQNENK